MTRKALWLIVVFAPMLAYAQASRSDFVRGAEIRTDAGGSLYRVLLPDEVYDTSTRGDLGDIRVLNARGETVPHTLREVPRPGVRDAEWRAAPSFPMTEAQSGTAARTHVRVGADGAVLEVTNDKAPGRSTTAYLIDASAVDEPVARIALTWEAAPDAAFLVPVSVTASNDLNNWRTVVSSAALAQLQRLPRAGLGGDSYTLTQNEIELTAGGDRSKYFRVSWPKELSAVTLKSVRVRPPSSIVEREIRWRTLSAEQIDPVAVAHYQTRAFLPIEYINLEFADATDAASVTVRSRSDPSAAWINRYNGLFYALQGATGVIHSANARIDVTRERFWSVETTREGGWKQNRAPRLKVGWHPHELFFVARGTGPYTLAYGSGRVGPAQAPVDELLASLDSTARANQVREATLGPPQTLGGVDALKPAPTPIPWKRVVLWAVLIVVVAALALMAARLFRESERGESPSS
jgi:Protein of unknown function (DUF3999)